MSAIFRRVALALFALIYLVAFPLSAFAQTQEPPKEIFPASQLPPSEQFPAARLLIAAYVVVIVVLFLYMFSVARRLTTVQREVERLEADVKRTSRS